VCIQLVGLFTREFCAGCFYEYNYVHHSGIAWHTPASVHFGTAGAIDQARQATLTAAYQAHPERFGRRPRPPAMPAQQDQPTARSVEPQATEVPDMPALAQPGRDLRLPKAHFHRRFVRFRGSWISATHGGRPVRHRRARTAGFKLRGRPRRGRTAVQLTTN
jgi:hypothetical protein